jgi:hypothetical protein
MFDALKKKYRRDASALEVIQAAFENGVPVKTTANFLATALAEDINAYDFLRRIEQRRDGRMDLLR